MVREIVTLQIGNDSNNIGAQLWNQLDDEFKQDNRSIDYNTYYTFDRKTNVPIARALIIDYRNTFGHLLSEEPVKIDSLIEIIKREYVNDFWSKELKPNIKFHSKSLIPLMDYWYPLNEDENQFNIYPIGQEVYRKLNEQIENSLHYLLESCDSLQTFRCLYDVNNGFSGLFTSIQDYLYDECPKKPMWSFAIGSDKSPLNLSMSLIHSLTENQMPTFSCLNSNDTKQTSLTIQQSLLSPTISLDLLADRLCPMKKNFLNIFSKIPFDLKHQTLFNYLDKNDLFQLKTPLSCHYFARGITKTDLYNKNVYNLNVNTSAELISTYLQEQYGTKMFISTNSWDEKYKHMSLITGLFNDDTYSFEFFQNLQNQMKKLNYKTLSNRWKENNFEEQTFEQLINNINTLHDMYQSN